MEQQGTKRCQGDSNQEFKLILLIAIFPTQLFNICSHFILFILRQEIMRMAKKSKLSTKSSISSVGGQPVNRSKNSDSPFNLLKSMKHISIKDIPFSQHIYPQQLQLQAKCSSANQFYSSHWSFEPFLQQNQLNSKTKLSKFKSTSQKNPFLIALELHSKKLLNKTEESKEKGCKKDFLSQIHQQQSEQQRISYRSFQRQTIKFRHGQS